MAGEGEDGEDILNDDSDDFVVMRRDVNAGRAVMSGPVLYSVAESVAQPRWVTTPNRIYAILPKRRALHAKPGWDYCTIGRLCRGGRMDV